MDHSIVMVKSEKGKSSCHQVAVCQDESDFPSQLESIENNTSEQYCAQFWLLHENVESARNPGHSRNPGSIHDESQMNPESLWPSWQRREGGSFFCLPEALAANLRWLRLPCIVHRRLIVYLRPEVNRMPSCLQVLLLAYSWGKKTVNSFIPKFTDQCQAQHEQLLIVIFIYL